MALSAAQELWLVPSWPAPKSFNRMNEIRRHRTGRSRRLVALAIVTILAPASTRAASEDCQDAVAKYNEAISDISSTLRRYTNCVSSSRGHDDCSSEFRRLKAAQSDFEDAVMKHRSECD